MSVGLGIFLAAIIVSLTLLYINRRRDVALSVKGLKPPRLSTLKNVLLIILSIALAIVATVIVYFWISNMPRTQESYDGIKLGMAMNEVQYIKGMPSGLYKETSKDHRIDWLTLPDSNDSIFNYPRWDFETDGVNIEIDFDKANGKVVAISCSIPPWIDYSDKGGANLDCQPLSGITLGMSENVLKGRLGTPDTEVISSSKEIVFKKYNARFLLDRQKVYSIEFKDPEWIHGSNLTINPTIESAASTPSMPLEVKPFDPGAFLKKHGVTLAPISKDK